VTIYRYESDLTPAEIFDKLRATARRASKGWTLTSDTLFYDIIDDTHFMLIRTGMAGAGGGQPPFCAELSTKDGKTVIKGRFQPSKAQSRFIMAFSILPIVAVLLLMPHMLLPFFPFYLLWLLMIYWLFWGLNSKLWPKSKSFVLSHVKKHLLRYSYEDVKAKFETLIAADCEPELTIALNGHDYMVIGYDDHVSIQRLGDVHPEEIAFPSLNALYEAETVDGICLKRDWDRISSMHSHEFDQIDVLTELHRLKHSTSSEGSQ